MAIFNILTKTVVAGTRKIARVILIGFKNFTFLKFQNFKISHFESGLTSRKIEIGT